MRETDRQDGFVLLEALVAFTVLVLVLVIFYDALAGNYQTAALVRERDVALAEGRSHLQGLGIAIPIRAGIDRGAYPSGARWEMVARALPAPTRVDGMPAVKRYLVTLTITGTGGRRLTRLQTIVFDERVKK